MNFEETEVLYNVYRGILRNNRSFQPGKSTAVEYRMDCPEYADLLKKYPFEKIAGKGTDLQRAIRVLKYLSPKLTHSPWYDGHVDCNALALLDYSLDKPEQGINCLNKAKILEEVCLALGIYARRVRFLPYSPFDFDCHVVTEIYDRPQEKWCMLDPTTNGYLVDEKGTILSLLEARERMAADEMPRYTTRRAHSSPAELEVLRVQNGCIVRITAAGRQFAALSGSVPLAKPVRVDWLLASPARPDAVQYTDCLTLSSAYRWMEENAETETASCLALRPGGGERLS